MSSSMKGRFQSWLGQIFQELSSSQASIDAGASSKVPEDQLLEEWADLIVASMNTSGKVYHDTDHVFEVFHNLEREVAEANAFSSPSTAGGITPDPSSKLAILFHDVIYYSLDKKLSPGQASLLKDVIVEEQQQQQDDNDNNDDEALPVLYLQPFAKHQDPSVSMVQAVFDMPVEPTPLPNLGSNEFLSALIAIRVLGQALTRRRLLQLAMCIEATIPFRPVDPSSGKSPADRLYERSLTVYSGYILDKKTLDDDAENKTDYLTTSSSTTINTEEAASVVSHAAQQAVLVANSDIGIFSNKDSTAFIDSNWRLFPEWFPVLLQADTTTASNSDTSRNHDCCSLVEMQNALATVRGRGLDPNLVFCVFQKDEVSSFPSTEWLKHKRQKATNNVTVLYQYNAIRLLSISLFLEVVQVATSIESIANLIRAPLLYELGGMERAATQNYNNGDNTKEDAWKGEKDDKDNRDAAIILQVLHMGRRVDYPWDAKESPFAAMLFKALHGSSQKVEQFLGQRPEKTTGREARREWLTSFPRVVLHAAVEGVVSIQQTDYGDYIRGELFQLLDL